MAIAIEKLRPDLVEKSDAELERLANEIAMAQAEKKRRANVAAMEAIAAQAADHVEAVVAGVKFLHEHGLLPDRVAAGFSRSSDGMFAPGMILRAPSAESMVPRTAGQKKPAAASGEKKFRRRKDPKTGEYIPSKAAQKAGVA